RRGDELVPEADADDRERPLVRLAQQGELTVHPWVLIARVVEVRAPAEREHAFDLVEVGRERVAAVEAPDVEGEPVVAQGHAQAPGGVAVIVLKNEDGHGAMRIADRRRHAPPGAPGALPAAGCRPTPACRA